MLKMAAVEEWVSAYYGSSHYTALNAHTCKTLNPLQFKEAAYFF